MSDVIADESTLRALHDPVSQLAQLKQIDHLDPHCRRFIALSPFLVIGSTRPGRGTDVSPRGDAPGFVQVIDEKTLFVPDRPGNNRLDTMSNLVHEAEVGLLFMIPGVDETLRVNGTARLSRDAARLAAAEVQGKQPKVGIEIAVREAFLHCGKALKRSRLWQDDYKVERSVLPSLSRMIVEQTKATNVDIEAAERRTEDAYRTKLW